MQHKRVTRLLLVASLAATTPWTTAAGPAGAGQTDPAVPADDGGTQWVRPEEPTPSLPGGDVKALPTAPSRPRQPSGYTALRAVSLREGEALLRLSDGQERHVRPGDLLGTDLVKAVDEGLIVLTRAAQPGRPGAEATVVMRFDAQGKPSVRVYYTEDPTPARPGRTQ